MRASDDFRDYKLWTALAVGAGGIWAAHLLRSHLTAYFNAQRVRQQLEAWEKIYPKDTVILHNLGPGKTAPSNSPFVLKLATYLRMCNIPYETETSMPFHPVTGKTPWITLNGKHHVDSQLIIEFLQNNFESAKFSKPFVLYSAETLAYGRAVRIMMDEHFYWALGLWRYVYDNDISNLGKIFTFPPAALAAFAKNTRKRVATNAWAQGTGRLAQEEVFQIMTDHLRAISVILGTKKFILGDQPSETDCSVFGMVGEALWCMPGSPYEKVILEELTNLQGYCIRMKETFWPDWDNCLAGAQHCVT